MNKLITPAKQAQNKQESELVYEVRNETLLEMNLKTAISFLKNITHDPSQKAILDKTVLENIYKLLDSVQ